MSNNQQINAYSGEISIKNESKESKEKGTTDPHRSEAYFTGLQSRVSSAVPAKQILSGTKPAEASSSGIDESIKEQAKLIKAHPRSKNYVPKTTEDKLKAKKLMMKKKAINPYELPVSNFESAQINDNGSGNQVENQKLQKSSSRVGSKTGSSRKNSKRSGS